MTEVGEIKWIKIGHQNLSLSKPLDVLQDTQQILSISKKLNPLKNSAIFLYILIPVCKILE